MADLNLLFCGDTMLRARPDGASPFGNVRDMLRQVDVAFCNLETCLSDGGIAADKKHVIRTSPAHLKHLTDSGFNVVNVANNHVFDFGLDACLETISHLKHAGMSIVGLQGEDGAVPIVLERKGVRIGFLGYANYGFSSTLMPLRERTAIRDVGRLSRSVDLVVVSLHWGYEYVNYPAPRQQRLAHRLVDAGARLVIGHHPHVVQGIETYRQALIAYSIGNLLSHIDDMPVRVDTLDRAVSYGTVLRVKTSGASVVCHTSLPVTLGSGHDVELLNASQRELSAQHIERLSARLNGRKIGILFWAREACATFTPADLDAWRERIRRFGPKHAFLMVKRFCKEPLNLLMLVLYMWDVICTKAKNRARAVRRGVSR